MSVWIIIVLLLSFSFNIVLALLIRRLKWNICEQEKELKLTQLFSERAPQISYRKYMSCDEIPHSNEKKYELKFDESGELQLPVLSENRSHFDEAYICLRILNNTPFGITIEAIVSQNELYNLPNGFEEINMDPESCICIFSKANPPPMGAVQLRFRGQKLKYPIHCYESGWLSPTIV